MKTRIISAIVALIIIVPLFIIGGYPFIIGVSILAFLAYKELLDLKKSHKPYPNLMLLLGLLSLVFILLTNVKGKIIFAGLTYQILALIILFLFIPIIFYKNDKYTSKDAFYLLSCTLFIGLSFNLLITLRNRGIYILLYTVLVPIITDIFAYLGGIFLGKNKMCPTISPKKTWEGAASGLIASTIINSALYMLLIIHRFSFKIILTTIILSIIGQLGDLVFSKIKRENEIKDFSNIMPGHGGILDRLDSIIFVVLAYIVLFNFI